MGCLAVGASPRRVRAVEIAPALVSGWAEVATSLVVRVREVDRPPIRVAWADSVPAVVGARGGIVGQAPVVVETSGPVVGGFASPVAVGEFPGWGVGSTVAVVGTNQVVNPRRVLPGSVARICRAATPDASSSHPRIPRTDRPGILHGEDSEPDPRIRNDSPRRRRPHRSPTTRGAAWGDRRYCYSRGPSIDDLPPRGSYNTIRNFPAIGWSRALLQVYVRSDERPGRAVSAVDLPLHCSAVLAGRGHARAGTPEPLFAEGRDLPVSWLAGTIRCRLLACRQHDERS